ERILAIASGRLGEQPVVVTTSEAGRIRAFDCHSGAPAGRSISVAPSVANGVDTVTVDGRLLVTLRCSHPDPPGDSKNWFIDPISTYDLATGKRALARQQRDLRPRHMHCRVINGEPLAAVSDGSNIEVVNLRSSKRVAHWMADKEVWTVTLFEA